MSIESNQHLASVTPVGRAFAGRVLNPLNLTFQTLMIFAASSGWCLLTLGGLVVSISGPPGASVGLVMVFTSMIWFVAVCVLGFVYPEWPHNRRLCQQLLNRVEIGTPPDISPFDPSTRVVELVPRDRWKKFCLETATDLMMMQVDEDGVWMKGDRYRYEIPRESILAAEYQGIRPPGWFCQSHMVILYVRTAAGTIDLPISYRDHRFGSLRSSRRRAEAMALVEKVNRIAKGQLYQPPLAPVSPVPSSSSRSSNPYAAPAMVDE